MAGLPDSIPVDKVESLLCCSVCLERLQEPRTLPCFHSYCKHCLENYVAKHREKAAKAGNKIEEFECPCCRTLFPLKENEDVANMRGSHFIRNMVDVLNAERSTNVWKCSNHNEKPSCCRCVSCEAFLCEECLKVHENWPGFKSHAVLTIEELKKPENQSKITGAMRCKEHTTKKLKFYCETCQVLICRYCMDFNHVRPEHVCHPVEKVSEKHRQALQACCDTLDEKQAEGEKWLKDVVDVENVLEKTAKNARENISKQKNDVMKAAQDIYKSKISEVDQLYDKHKEQLRGRRDKISSFLDKAKCACTLSKNVLQKGSDEEIIESRKMVEERVEAVKKESNDVKDPVKPLGIGKNWFVVKQVDIKLLSSLFGGVLKAIFPDSTILQTEECFQAMRDWFYKEGDEWQLCYRASIDGWYAENFHAKCDDTMPTVVLVKVNQFVFGGFTDTNWKPKKEIGNTNASGNSFMFSLKNKDNLMPFKSSILKVDVAAVSNKDFGAIFGNGAISSGIDLLISGHPPTQKCYANLGNAYELPHGYQKSTAKAGALLAGSSAFTPSEIEVFYLLQN